MQMELAIGPNISSRVRLLTNKVILVPSRDKILLYPRKLESEYFEKAEEMALEILTLLPHTPLRGYGVNFHFLESGTLGPSLDLFNADDYSELIRMGLNPIERRIIRNLKVDEICELNLTLISNSDKGMLHIGCNFHHAMDSGVDVSGFVIKMRGKVSVYKSKIIQILDSVYGLNMEEELGTDD